MNLVTHDRMLHYQCLLISSVPVDGRVLGHEGGHRRRQHAHTCNDHILSPKHSEELLQHLECFKNSLETTKKPLQRLENLPVSRDLVSGPRVFEPHLRGLQARAQGVHPALERHCFQSAAKLAPTSNSHMTVSCASNDWPVAAECMQ